MSMSSGVYKKFMWSGLVLAGILVAGTIGYWLIGGRQDSFLDTLYMTVITVSTIGFYEVIDLSANPAGRAFTIVVAVSGVGLMAYVVTSLTALLVEGELTQSFRRRKMERIARNTKDHCIVCGMGGVGVHIANELSATGRPQVTVDSSRDNIDRALATFRDEIFVEGDATDNDTLLKAGIENAMGVFAVTGDDNQNLVISLTAKQLNPRVRVVARCNDIKNGEKMRKTGADEVISPDFIGGLRMASEMVRPTVVSFLDIMLRDRERNLRVEEIPVPESYAGQPVSALQLTKYPHLLLLAIRRQDGWEYNPAGDYVIGSGSTLVFMTTPEAREKLARLFHAG